MKLTMTDKLYSKDLAVWYDKLYYSAERTEEEILFYEKIFRKNNCNKILELSAGSGRLSIPLAKMGFDVLGTDISKHMINLARQNAKGQNIKLRFYVQDMRKTKLSEAPFDCVIIPCSAFLYLCKNEDAIKTIKRCFCSLKKNGFLVIDINNYWGKIIQGRSGNTLRTCQSGPWEMKINSSAKLSNFNNTGQMIQQIFRTQNSSVLNMETRSYDFRVFTYNEIDLLFRLTGFKILNSYSDYSFRNISEENIERIIILAKKRL